MIVEGTILSHFMGARILVPFAGPLRNAAAACSGNKQPRSGFRMAEGKTVPAISQTAYQPRPRRMRIRSKYRNSSAAISATLKSPQKHMKFPVCLSWKEKWNRRGTLMDADND
jgi:hypothetical protein